MKKIGAAQMPFYKYLLTDWHYGDIITNNFIKRFIVEKLGRGGVSKFFLQRAGGWCKPAKKLTERHLGAFPGN